MANPESVTQNAILRTFGTVPGLRIWRANTGTAIYKGRAVTFGVPGQADITGILPVSVACPNCHCSRCQASPTVGMRLEIEVKSATGTQQENQRRYQAIIERFGGLYVLARSVEDVRRAIARAGGML